MNPFTLTAQSSSCVGVGRSEHLDYRGMSTVAGRNPKVWRLEQSRGDMNETNFHYICNDNGRGCSHGLLPSTANPEGSKATTS